MSYDFDEIIDRTGTNALKMDGFRQYIFDADESMEFAYDDDEFIHMWVADMEFATADVILDGIRERLDDRILGYTKIFDSNYYEAVTGWTKRRNNWTFLQEELVTSPGIIPALNELVEYICTDEDDKVLILTPSYANFKSAVDNADRELVTSDLIDHGDGSFEIDVDDVQEKLEDESIKLCIFCNPHNPTGRVWSEEELKKFGELLVEKDIWLISDEIHCDILREDQQYSPYANVLPDYEKLVITFSQSKAFNIAGLMFSNVVIRDEGLRNVWKENHYDFENPLSVAGHQAAYEKGDEWLDAMNAYLDENFQFTYEFIQENLPKAVFEIPESTYLAWVNIEQYLPEDVEDVALYFANHSGVLLEGGNMFVDNAEGYIRLNLAMPKSMLEEGLKRISKLLNHPNE